MSEAAVPVLGTCQAAGGPSGINLDGLPPLPDPEALETHARSLSSAGSGLSGGAGEAAKRWAGLAGVYQAPEADVVLAGFAPVIARASEAASLLANVGSSLNRYAERTRGLQTRLAEVRVAVGALDELILGNDDWHSKHGILNQHRDTYNEVSALAQEILNSDAECASDLRALIGGSKVAAPVVEKLEIGTSKDPFSNVLSHVRHFFGGDEEHPEQDWGPPTPSMRLQGGWAVGQGAVSAVIGSAQGSYTLLGTSDVEEQRQAWQGLGGLVVAGVRTSLAVHRGPSNLSADDVEAIMTVNEAGKSAFYVDKWDKDPAFSAGSLGFDVGSMFLGGAAALKGGSLGAKAGTLGAKAGATAEDAASTGSRFVTRLEDLPSDARLAEKFKDTLAQAQDTVSSIQTGAWDIGVKSELDELKDPTGVFEKTLGKTEPPEVLGPNQWRTELRGGTGSSPQFVPFSGDYLAPDGSAIPTRNLAHPRQDLIENYYDEQPAMEGLPIESEIVQNQLPKDFVPWAGMGRDAYDREFTTGEFYPGGDPKIRSDAWPDPNSHPDGFRNPVERYPVILREGYVFDRYGSPRGKFVAPDGSPFPGRALPDYSLTAGYHRYEVMHDLPGWAGPAAPAFAREGGGPQFLLPVPVKELLERGFIKEITR